MIQFDKYFSNGLVQPPTSHTWIWFHPLQMSFAGVISRSYNPKNHLAGPYMFFCFQGAIKKTCEGKNSQVLFSCLGPEEWNFFSMYLDTRFDTPPKFNMEPENMETIIFTFHVKFRGCIQCCFWKQACFFMSILFGRHESLVVSWRGNGCVARRLQDFIVVNTFWCCLTSCFDAWQLQYASICNCFIFCVPFVYCKSIGIKPGNITW